VWVPRRVVPVELEGKTDEGFQFLRAGNFLGSGWYDKYPFLIEFQNEYIIFVEIMRRSFILLGEDKLQ